MRCIFLIILLVTKNRSTSTHSGLRTYTGPTSICTVIRPGFVEKAAKCGADATGTIVIELPDAWSEWNGMTAPAER